MHPISGIIKKMNNYTINVIMKPPLFRCEFCGNSVSLDDLKIAIEEFDGSNMRVCCVCELCKKSKRGIEDYLINPNEDEIKKLHSIMDNFKRRIGGSP
jgi:hypothetical protein